MRHQGVRAVIAVLAPGLALVACGTASDSSSDTPQPGTDGLVAASPRALAAVLIEHVDPGEPRRTTGEWSDANDPPAIEAQVDYGVDPEGTEDGVTRSVRIDVSSLEAFEREDRAWFRCRPRLEGDDCEEQQVDGTRVLYRWRPGTAEEEGGYYSWLVVRDDEVVQVSYERSGLFGKDPRTLDLPQEPEDLRAAALDPAMSLRTTLEAWGAGAELDNYEGVEEPPEEPIVRPTSPEQLAARVADYVGRRPGRIVPTPRRDFGPEAVGVRLHYPATERHAAFTLDVLTTTGRVRQIDPLPCQVQKVRTAEQGCFAWEANSASTWTLATADEPGRQWIIGAQDDDSFNRVESVGVLITSEAIDHNPFAQDQDPGGPPLPEMLMADLNGMTADLTIGPEQQRQ